MTKLHEELLRGAVAEVAEEAKDREWLGEVTLVLGTHTFDASGDAGRRQAAAVETMRTLTGVLPVNVQFARRGHTVDGLETIAVLGRDSCTVTGRPGT